MSHLTLSSCVLALGLVAGAGACHTAPLPVSTSQSGLIVLVGHGGGGFGGGGRGFGGDGGFARGGEDRAIADDAYRDGRYWGGGYIGGGGYGYGYDCGAYALGDWPRGTCDQF